MKYNCLFCNKECIFDKRRKANKYCSNKCQFDDRSKAKLENWLSTGNTESKWNTRMAKKILTKETRK